MNKRFLALALGVALALPATASAQTFGQFTGAQTLAVNEHMLGGYLSSSSGVFGLLGQLRLSFYPGVDFGFQGGLARQDYNGGDRTTLRLGTDLKYQVTQPGAPYAISVGGGLAVESGDDWNILTVGPSIVGSRSFPGDGNLVWTPYASLGIVFANINVGSFDDSDMSVPVRLGSELKLAPQLALTGELQLRLSDTFNDDVGFAIGVNSPF